MASDGRVRTLDEPLHVRFRLADGVTVVGELTQWDGDGFDGSFGRRAWLELATDEVWRLYRRVIEHTDADQWIHLGRLLQQMPGGQAHAERAFRRGLSIDAEAGERIDAAKAEAAAAIARREAAATERAKHRLRTTSPEAGEWPADPWPALDAAARLEATQRMRAHAKEALSRVGLSIDPIETDDLLVYSDLPRKEVARWTLLLEKTRRRFDRLLGVAEVEPIFWGKAVVLILADSDRFRLVEAQTFDQLVPRGLVGISHPMIEDGNTSPGVTVVMQRVGDDERFEDTLVHQMVLALLHRYHSPRRLPAWANDGLALYISEQINRESSLIRERRGEALRFIRGGHAVAPWLGMTYDDDGWPGPSEIGTSLGYLLVALMIEERPIGFVSWVGAVKAGAVWSDALEPTIGMTPAALVERFVAFHRVND